MSEQQNKGICPPHNPTGEWSVRDGKSYATCKNCGEYETSLMEKDTSPITMEEKERVGFITGKLSFIKNTNVPIYKANINEEISKVILVNDLPSVISSAVSQALEEERQFILNVLDGIDEADRQMNNTGGGTLAIRHALQSRIIK